MTGCKTMVSMSRFLAAALLLLAGASAARAEGAMVTVPAPRPVTVRVETASADIEVRRGAEPKIVLQVDDEDVGTVKLVSKQKDVLEAVFDGQSMLPSGQVRLLVPAGCKVDLHSQSGDIRVRDLGAEARVRSLSGDIKVSGAVGADVRTVSGDLNLEASGNMRVKTVSGDVQVRDQRTSGGAVIELETTSGDVSWSGQCGAGCRLSASSMSGDLQLALDPRSSFAFTMQSHSGELEDGLGLQLSRSGGRHRGVDAEGRYGKGEGSVDGRTFSGDIHLYKR
jgi:DUF4097 and DUF4098 domain-containing protein YvlB